MGKPPYIGAIVSLSKEIRGNSKGRVESESGGQRVLVGMC